MVSAFADLGDYSEDERIRVIGETVMAQPHTSADKPFVAGIALENEAKAERYKEKLLKRFPTIRIIDIAPGIVPGTVMLRVGTPAP